MKYTFIKLTLAISLLVNFIFLINDPTEKKATMGHNLQKSQNNINEIYFMPNEGNNLKNNLIDLISNSKKSISIAMYNMNDVDIIHALEVAYASGVNVRLFLDKKKSKKIKINIPYKTIVNRKMHLKIALFDDVTAYTGSANWKGKSFTKNYDLGIITNDNNHINTYKKIFTELDSDAY